MNELQVIGTLITFLPICVCICFVVISCSKYIRTRDKYWILAIVDYLIYLFASALQMNNQSIFYIHASTIFYALFYVFVFFTITRENKKNVNLRVLIKENGVYLMFVYLPIILMLSFTIYFYIVLNTIGHIPEMVVGPVFFITIIYPIFDMFFLSYYLLSENILNIKHTKVVRLFFSLGFLFLIIGDTIYIFETVFNFYIWIIDYISAAVSVAIFSFALFYTKRNKDTFDYSSLNLISQEEEMLFDYRIVVLGVLIVYSCFYLFAMENKNIGHEYFLKINSNGMIIFILIIFSNFLIIGCKEKQIEKLQEESAKDFLTGAYSKRYGVSTLESLFSYSKNYGIPIAVLMLDIDYFKEYNDTWGHPEGDRILREIVRIIASVIGEQNMVSRYGGEEFLILLFNVSRNQGKEICENIRRKVDENKFVGEETQPLGKITVSIGGFHMCMDTKNKDELITKADKALYKAKINRNTCVWYSD